MSLLPLKVMVTLALATLAAIFAVAGFVFLNASATTLPVPTPISATCGIQSCHGLDISCGTNVPESCTEEYRLGDRCRTHASCQKQNGACLLVKDDMFNSCISCVNECQTNFPNDPSAMFQCESTCQ